MSVSGSGRAAGDNETSSHSRGGHSGSGPVCFETILMTAERIKHGSGCDEPAAHQMHSSSLQLILWQTIISVTVMTNYVL